MWYLFITSPSQLKAGSLPYGMCYCINDQITSCYFSNNIYKLLKDSNFYTKPRAIYSYDLGLCIQSFINSNYCTVLPIGEVMENAKTLYPELFI